jgi:hypothetical protein
MYDADTLRNGEAAAHLVQGYDLWTAIRLHGSKSLEIFISLLKIYYLSFYPPVLTSET